MTTSLKVQKSIKEQGRKKVWLAKELGISRQYLDRKLKDNYFDEKDIQKFKELGLI